MPAGGPFALTATRTGAAQTASDVLVGDVFLCSGQSNMELPVSRSTNGAAAARGSANDRLRLMTIAHASSAAPLAQFQTPVSWRPATSESVQDFSAACYYFARDLQPRINVPIGLIHASWGGANIESFISADSIGTVPGFGDRVELLNLYARDPAAANARLGQDWERWWRAHAAGTPWDPQDAAANWPPAPEPMRNWKTWGVPELANHNGMVWFRRTVRLTPEQAAQTSRLSLGAIDEVDETWVNGRPIANTFGWAVERTYDLPAGALHAGDNVIVVNVLSTWDSGGMFGPAEHVGLTFADGARVSLAGEWRYQFVSPSVGAPPRGPWHSIGGLSGLYNAMIAPIGPYGVRGVLWYQGEANTEAPDQYQTLLTTLMADWRKRFDPRTPFLIVQLPNFGAAPSAPMVSGWASVREAQRRAVLADANAGLAVSIDIGQNDELHPPNKLEIGRRLARAARHVIYGEPITPSGPRAVEAHRAGGAVVVTFADVEQALIAISGAGPNGFEVCGADQTSCRFVTARIEGGAVRLDLPADLAAQRVRYCWGDGPICTLYDRSALPAGPFELTIQ